MPTNPQRTLRPFPRSVGNVALADESLGHLYIPKAKTRSPQVRLVWDMMEESGVEALAPTIGMMKGFVCLSRCGVSSSSSSIGCMQASETRGSSLSPRQPVLPGEWRKRKERARRRNSRRQGNRHHGFKL